MSRLGVLYTLCQLGDAMTHFFNVKEDGKTLFRVIAPRGDDLHQKIEEIVALNILRGHDRITKSQAVMLAINFYHNHLRKEEENERQTL